jgi:hypothetical protein
MRAYMHTRKHTNSSETAQDCVNDSFAINGSVATQLT